MKRGVMRLFACAAGFGAAMLIMAAAIYFGYSEAYRTETNSVVVNLCGLSVYHITKGASGYVGEAIGPHMGAICGVCAAAAIVAEELCHRLRRQ